MSYTAGDWDRVHALLVWGGTLPGGETWSNSLRMARTEEGFLGDNDIPQSSAVDLLNHVTDVVKAHHANGGAMISNRCNLTYVKFNRIAKNGKYADATSNENHFDPIAGGTSGNVHPNQVALAVTFTTGISRGPANKGRIFAPMPACAIGTDGMISAGDADNLKDRYRSLIEDLSDTPGLDTPDSLNVVIMSRKSGHPDCRRIDGLRIGRVLDTQRRRRRSLPENYVLNDVDEGTF